MKRILCVLFLLLSSLVDVSIGANIQLDLIAKWPMRFPKEPEIIAVDPSGGRVFCGFGNILCLLDDENISNVLSYLNLGDTEEGIQSLVYDDTTKILYVALGRQGMRMIDATSNTLAEKTGITYPDYRIAAHTDVDDQYQYFIDEKIQKCIADFALYNDYLYMADYCFGLREIDVDLSVDSVLEETNYYKNIRYSQYFAGGYHNIVVAGARTVKLPQKDSDNKMIRDAQGNILYEQVPQVDEAGNLITDEDGDIQYEDEDQLFDKSYAFVLDRYWGLRVLDLDGLYVHDDPLADRKVNLITDVDLRSSTYYYQESLVTDLEVVGERAYITDLGHGLTILGIYYDNFYLTDEDGTANQIKRLAGYYGNNIYDPDSTYASPQAGNALGLEVLNDYAYIVGQTSGLTIVDVGQKLEETKILYDAEKAELDAKKKQGTYSDEEIEALEVALQKTRDQNIVGHYLRNETVLHDIKLYEKDANLYAFLADYRRGLIKVDVTDPAAVSETITQSFDTPSGADAIYVASVSSGEEEEDDDNVVHYIYIVDDDGDREGLRILKIMDTMEIQKVDDDGKPLFNDSGEPVTYTEKVLDPKLVGFHATPGNAQGIYVSGGFAYIADGPGGLYVIDIRDPKMTNATTYTFATTDARDVVVKDDFAYVADGGGGLKIIDVSSGESRGTTISYPDFDQAQGVFVLGNLVYVADGENGLRKIDISESKSDGVVTTYTAAEDANAVHVISNTAYVADGASGLRIIDVGTDPVETITVATTGYAQDVRVNLERSYAYVAEGIDGLEIIDIVNGINISADDDTITDLPADTKEVFLYDLPLNSGDQETEYVFLADGPAGLKIVTATPGDSVNGSFVDGDSGLNSSSCFITSLY